MQVELSQTPFNTLRLILRNHKSIHNTKYSKMNKNQLIELIIQFDSFSKHRHHNI